jgi:hypothetical protein
LSQADSKEEKEIKFQNEKNKLNHTNNEEIEEIYDQDFDVELSQTHSNNNQSNDLNALKNISQQGHSTKLVQKPLAANANISKNSSVNIDKLLQSKYSNYSYKFDEVDSYETSKDNVGISKLGNNPSKAKEESSIAEEIIQSGNYEF